MYTTCTDIMYMCWVCVWKLLAILIAHLYISVASTSPSSCRRIVGTIPLVGPVDDDGASPGEGGSLSLYKRMAMAHNVNRRRYTDLLIPLVPVQGKVGPSYKCMAMAHHVNSRRYRQTSSYLRTHLPIPMGTPCQQQEAHRPPHTHVHKWLVHQEVHTPPRTSHRVHMDCAPGGIHTLPHTHG